MSGKLSFQLEVLGVEQVAKKLSDLDKLASTVGKKGITLQDFSKVSASTKALNPELFKQLGEKAGKAFGTGFENGRFEAMELLSRRNITGSSSSMIAMQAAIASSDAKHNAFLDAQIAKERILQTIRREAIHDLSRRGGSQDAINMQAAIASSDAKHNAFLDAQIAKERILQTIRREAIHDLSRRGGSQDAINMQAAIAQSDYNLNNYKGKSPPIIGATSKFADLIPKLAAFGLVVWGVKQALSALEPVVREVSAAFKRGFNNYVDSAKIGTSQSRLAQLRSTLGLIGVDESEADRLLLGGQFNRTRTGGSLTQRSIASQRGAATGFMGEILGAQRGVNQIGELQQINNLQKEALMAWDDTAKASLSAGLSSRALFEGEYNLKLIFLDLKAVFNDVVAIASPIINSFTAALNILINELLDQLNTVVFIMQQLHLIPKGKDFDKSLGGGSSRIPVSQFEKIGFHFGGVGSGQNDVGKNTGKAVGLLTQINNGIQHIAVSIAAPKRNISAGGLDPYADYTPGQLKTIFNMP